MTDPQSLAGYALKAVMAAVVWAGFGLTAAALSWLVFLVAFEGVSPLIPVLAVPGFYLTVAGIVAWEHFDRQTGVMASLLVGISWLPLMMAMRRD